MNIDKQKLKALAEAATQSHGARRVEVDHNGVHVIGDGSWKILSAWHTPEGKGSQNAEFAAAASPATVLALLAENDMLAAQRLMHVRLNLSLRARRKVWVAACEKAEDELLDALAERDQLKAENEALRDGANFRAIQSLRADCDALRKDAERYRWLRDEEYLHNWAQVHVCDESRRAEITDAAINAAMANEVSHD